MVFSNSAAFEAKRKALLGRGRFATNKKVHQAFISRTKAELEKTALPVFWFDESLQKGADFSERITNAVQSLFTRGVERLIVVGTDTPSLSARLVKKAARQVQNGYAIIGPAKDGGVYLLALNACNFVSANFVKLPWQKKSLLQDLLSYVDDHCINKVLLKTLRDVDIAEDLFGFLYRSSSSLKRSLAQLLSISIALFQRLYLNLHIGFSKSFPSRGPPVLCS